MEQAVRVIGLSQRQCYRIKARVKEHGAKGVLHGNRGRPCKRKRRRLLAGSGISGESTRDLTITI